MPETTIQPPFRGGPVLTLDQKGRITVPAPWRKQLEESFDGRLTITKNDEGGLGLYPPPAWAQLERTILDLPNEHEAWRRIVLGNAEELQIDSSSRLLIPPELRRAAGLERDVKFMGMGSYFELWDLARYEVHEAQAIARGKPEPLRNLKLV